MNDRNLNLTSLPQLPWLAATLLLALATGCGREEVKVYQVEKEKPAGMAQANPHAANPHGASPHGPMAAMPKVTGKLPAGWTEQAPSAMRAASFAIQGAEDQKAEVAVVPLRGVTGRDLEMVNLWRNQVGLEPVKAEELEGLLTKVTVGPTDGKLADMASKEPPAGQKQALRVLVAMLDREGTAWFFKMTGADALVAAQKPAFVEFLKSIEFQPEAAPAAAAPSFGPLMSASPMQAADAGANPEKPSWTVPAGWQEAPGGQFLVAKFNLTGEGGAQAAVNVSSSSGEGGGWAGNVNRWRGQLGLSALSPDEITKATTALDASGGKAMLVEIAGTDARTTKPAKLVGVMVPQPGQAWFYKLMGDPPVVESQKDAFTKFVQSVKY